MIRCGITIDNGKIEAVIEGGGTKRDLYALVGLLEDVKFKLISIVQDDGSSIAFVVKTDKDKYGEV